jgi:hypothetical protein
VSTTTWVVQHGLAVAADPAALPFRYAAPMYDVLAVGPQHVDVAFERLLRQAAGMPSDTDVLDLHRPLLGHDVVLLTGRELARTLSALWWIDAMSQRGADVRRVRLALAPDFAPASVIVQAIADSTPIGEDLEPLRRLRRSIAADDAELRWTLDAVSEARRAWVSVVDRLRDLLPDARGLDVFDAQLLARAGTEWTSAVAVVGLALGDQDEAHRMGDRFLWERLQQLAENHPAAHPRDARGHDDERTPLVALDVRGEVAMRCARVRRTAFGDQVLAGRDALEIRGFDRWLGGRFLTRDRVFREGLRRV